MSWTMQQVRELKVNRYIVIDDEPSKIIELTTSKPGKHGEAKARIVAIGISCQSRYVAQFGDPRQWSQLTLPSNEGKQLRGFLLK